MKPGLRALLAGTGVLAALAVVAPLPASAQPGLDQNSVTVVVRDMAPTTPAYTAKPSPLTIVLALTNTTDQELYNVNLGVDRDAPISQQKLLEQLMAKPAPGAQGGLTQLGPKYVGTLSPHETRQVIYKTTTSSLNDPKSLCLCIQSGGGVYPINFTVSAAPDPDAGSVPVGFGQTYLPAFKDTPKPVQVSWVWPLIDRPHRLEDNQPFVDDDLAASVKPGGRLDRALRAVELAGPRVHLTLMIDPELLDELVAMTQPYAVNAGGKVTPGTGTAAATAWLARLRHIVAVVPTLQVSVTAYADPDIDALADAGLGWRANLGPDQLQRLQSALGTPPGTDIAWPPGGTITPAALEQVLSTGSTSAIVVSDKAMPGASHQTPRPDALAPLPVEYGSSGTVAAVTDSAVQTWSDRVLSGNAGPAYLPQLAAELAVRADEQPGRSHYVVITAPRYVDVDPTVASRALVATAHTTWSKALTLGEATKQVHPVDHGQLVEPAGEPRLPATTVAAAASAAGFNRSFSSALDNADDAQLVVGTLPAAIQRTESAAWRSDPSGSADFADQLTARVQALRRGVYILRPSGGSYTLASNDAPLPITIVNTLPVDIRVRVSVTTSNGVTGFESNSQRVQLITRAASPHSPTRSSLKIPTHVQRAGTFEVNAVLLAPDGTKLGSPVPLSIHCTALGAIGVIITAVAGGILVLALAFRVVRRIRARGKRPVAEMATAPISPAGVNP